MKKFFLILFLIFSSFCGFTQTVYRCSMAELYTLDPNTKDWTLDTKLSNLKIDITIEDEFISFHAKSPTMYRVYNNTKEPLTTKSLQGFRYDGRDLKTDDEVKIDIFKSKTTNIAVISIINFRKSINFRYFLEVEE